MLNQLTWALFVLLTTLVCCQPTKLIWAFFFLKFFQFPPPPPPNYSLLPHLQNYREILHNVDPPCIPYLGVALTDLTFTEVNNWRNGPFCWTDIQRLPLFFFLFLHLYIHSPVFQICIPSPNLHRRMATPIWYPAPLKVPSWLTFPNARSDFSFLEITSTFWFFDTPSRFSLSMALSVKSWPINRRLTTSSQSNKSRCCVLPLLCYHVDIQWPG